MDSRKDHWEAYWSGYRADPPRRVTHQLTRSGTLRLLKDRYHSRLPKNVFILDLGCGDGGLSYLIADALSSLGVRATLVGCDVSATALASAHQNFASESITFVQADARQLPFPDGCFDGVISFGYASVASYYDGQVQREVFRVTRAGGWLIADFRNHLSLWFILFRPWWVLDWIKRFQGRGKPHYALGTWGLKSYFASHGFKVASNFFLLSFPPWRWLPEEVGLLLEKSAGVTGLSRWWGRVFLSLMVRDVEEPELGSRPSPVGGEPVGA